jgi:hypothetical protein
VGSSQAKVLLQRKIVEISDKIAELEHVQTYLTGKLREMHQREDVSAQESTPAPILAP